MKRKIKLNEMQLRNIISESIRNALREGLYYEPNYEPDDERYTSVYFNPDTKECITNHVSDCNEKLRNGRWVDVDLVARGYWTSDGWVIDYMAIDDIESANIYDAAGEIVGSFDIDLEDLEDDEELICNFADRKGCFDDYC